MHGLKKKKIVKPTGVVVKRVKKRKGTRGKGLRAGVEKGLRAGVDCGHFLRILTIRPLLQFDQTSHN